MTHVATVLSLAVIVLGSGCSGPADTTRVATTETAAPVEAEPRGQRALGADDREALAKRVRTLEVPEEQSRLAGNCLAGAMSACEALGDDYRAGVGVKKDPRTTQLFYDFTRLLAEDYCDDGGENIDGCSQLGRMHFEGKGVRQNREWGTTLLRKGCAGGDDTACAYLENEGIAHFKK